MTVNSIRTKLTGMIALTILVPVILATIISYWYVKDRERERGLQLTEWSLERGTLQFERYISDLSRLPTSLYANRDVLDILEYGPGLSLEQTELEVRRALLGMYLSREDVAQIQLLILEDMDSFAAYKMKVSPRSKKQPSPIQQQLLENKESRVLLEASHPLVPYHDFGPILSEQEVVTLHFRLDKIETDTPLAVLSIDIPEDVFVGSSGQVIKCSLILAPSRFQRHLPRCPYHATANIIASSNRLSSKIRRFMSASPFPTVSSPSRLHERHSSSSSSGLPRSF